jgi:hypothetical protein
MIFARRASCFPFLVSDISNDSLWGAGIASLGCFLTPRSLGRHLKHCKKTTWHLSKHTKLKQATMPSSRPKLEFYYDVR